MDLSDGIREALGGDGDRATLAQRAAEALRSGARFRWVGIYEITVEDVVMIAYAGPNAPAYPVFPVTRGLTSNAIRSRRPIISNDVARDPRYLTELDSTGSEMILRVLDDAGRVVGTIDVETDRIAAFGEDDVAAVSACIPAICERLFQADARSAVRRPAPIAYSPARPSRNLYGKRQNMQGRAWRPWSNG